tara:strand:- start:404 stop:1696 length:1293 start_codon:yes stop_codon:yes gene_type:complete
LIIPYFFNYKDKAEIIKSHLKEIYNFEIDEMEKIKYQAFPIPRLEFKNVSIKYDSFPEKLTIQNLKIYPKLFNIYNYKNYNSNKVVLKNNSITLEASNLKILITNLFNQNKKFFLDNLNLKVSDKNKNIINVKNIKFANYGYKKNLIRGMVFDKKFETKLNDDFNDITFTLINSGFSSNIKFNKRKINDQIEGVFKSKLLNTKLKFDFNYNNKKINIFNSFFRSKNLSFRSKNQVIFDPFIEMKSKFEIDKFNKEILKKINLNKILASKNIIKKINSKNEFNFKSTKFSRYLIDELNLKTDLAYGRMTYSKNFLISDHLFKCQGNINLLEEYPLLFFDCNINSDNKQKFLKQFSIDSPSKDETLKLSVVGNINILNQKINFKKILLNAKYDASKEDLKYFKYAFESILFKKSFLEIFNLKKVKEFILEVS